MPGANRRDLDRPLTEGERRLLPATLSAGLNLSDIRIVRRHHNPLAALLKTTVVRGVRIFWANAPAEALTLAERAHLAHELVHVWQYRRLGKTGLEILFDRRYRYRLTAGRPFLSYGYEQQAAIVEDYVRVKAGAPPRRALAATTLSAYDRTFA